jgi:hypothetical protein
VSGIAFIGSPAKAKASKARSESEHGPVAAGAVQRVPFASPVANGALVSKSKIWPQIVCFPGAGFGHARGDPHPPPPVPMHVVTPVDGSVSSAVVPSSHTVGGNIGTH